MRTDDFDYHLPTELIAQSPIEPRDSSRLMILNRDSGAIEHRQFPDLLEYLESGDIGVPHVGAFGDGQVQTVGELAGHCLQACVRLRARQSKH